MKNKLFSIFVGFVLHPLGLETKKEADFLCKIYNAVEVYQLAKGGEDEYVYWKELEKRMAEYDSWRANYGPNYVGLPQPFERWRFLIRRWKIRRKNKNTQKIWNQ
jgi:hypothetical protein